MFYITGDTHIPIDTQKLTVENFPLQDSLKRSDYLIICGDFGGIWDSSPVREDYLNWLNSRNFTTLFVDGNHENFDALYDIPVDPWNGGKVHYIRDNILHLMRGNVFNIDGRKFFTMGGGNSVDKAFRTIHKSWWPQELPSREEYNIAAENLQNNNNQVDYVITHTAPTSIVKKYQLNDHHEPELNDFFQRVMEHVRFKKWFFGHFHQDNILNEQFCLMYNKIYDLQNDCML